MTKLFIEQPLALLGSANKFFLIGVYFHLTNNGCPFFLLFCPVLKFSPGARKVFVGTRQGHNLTISQYVLFRLNPHPHPHPHFKPKNVQLAR